MLGSKGQPIHTVYRKLLTLCSWTVTKETGRLCSDFWFAQCFVVWPRSWWRVFRENLFLRNCTWRIYTTESHHTIITTARDWRPEDSIGGCLSPEGFWEGEVTGYLVERMADTRP